MKARGLAAAALAAVLAGCGTLMPGDDAGEVVSVRCPAYEAPRPLWDCPIREDFATPDDYNALVLCLQEKRDFYDLKRELWDRNVAGCPGLP